MKILLIKSKKSFISLFAEKQKISDEEIEGISNKMSAKIKPVNNLLSQ